MKIYMQCILLFHCETSPACLIHQLRGDATPRVRSGVVMLQGLPASEGSLRSIDRCQRVSSRTTGPVQPPLVKEWEVSACVQRRKINGEHWLCPVGKLGKKGQGLHREEGLLL